MATPALTANQDIMLHISMRPNENVIVRNHYQNGKWASEERGGSSVRAHETFEILILAEQDAYKIAMNGHHITQFQHRLPLHLVQFIYIHGDAVVEYVLYEHDTNAKPHHIGVSQNATPSAPIMPMPYTPMNVQVHNPRHPNQHPPPNFFNQGPPNYPVSVKAIKEFESFTISLLLFLA